MSGVSELCFPQGPCSLVPCVLLPLAAHTDCFFICCNFHHILLLGKKTFFSFDDASFSWPSPEENKEKQINAFFFLASKFCGTGFV